MGIYWGDKSKVIEKITGIKGTKFGSPTAGTGRKKKSKKKAMKKKS